MTSAAVGREDLERQLEVVRALAPGEMEGVFGPDSLTWRIDREALTFLGAGRALLLQLAHPWVAAAIVEHSKTVGDPIGRFHRTFAVVFTMVFGTLDQALSAAPASPPRRYPRPPADHRRTFLRRLSVSSQRSCGAALGLCHLGRDRADDA